MRIPFNAIDEGVHLLDTAVEPWSIHLEARVSGALDEARFRSALAQALALHPMARARKAPSLPSAHNFEWEIAPQPGMDPLTVVSCADEVALSAARAKLLSLSVPLADSPPFRGRLARHPSGDVAMLNVNPAVTDAFGALRFLRSIARAYAAEPDPTPEVNLASRDVGLVLGARGEGGQLLVDD